MREIEPRHGRWRRHRHALGEIDAGVLGCVEQIEDGALLGVIGLRRIAGRRANAAIFFRDEIVIPKRLFRRIAPELAPHLRVHRFGERFRQTIAERLGHDGRVIVIGALKADSNLFFANPRRHREGADIIGRPVLCDEISEREIAFGAARRPLVHLLAQREETCLLLRAPLVFPKHDVIAIAISGPKADHARSAHPFLSDELIQHRARIFIERTRRLADDVVLQDIRIAPDQIPRRKERRPIDVRHKLFERVFGVAAHAEEARLHRRKLQLRRTLARFRDRHTRPLVLPR